MNAATVCLHLNGASGLACLSLENESRSEVRRRQRDFPDCQSFYQSGREEDGSPGRCYDSLNPRREVKVSR